MAVLLITAALAAQPMCVYGASSSSASDSGTSSTANSSQSKTTVSVSSTGVKTTGATTSKGQNGSMIGVAVDTVTTTGEPVTTNAQGEAVVGNTAIGFADGEKAQTEGLPETAVAAINAINSGQNLAEAVKDVNLDGYNALTGTHAIITKDAVTGEVKTGNVEVSLYVPNLVEGLGNVEVLFYDNATGMWKLLPAAKVDPATKTVAVNIPGSGTLSVVYKK